MPPPPLLTSILLGASAVFGSLGLALDPSPLSGQAALLIGSGGSALTVITVSGVLLARGRWARWTALVVAALWFIPPVIGPIDAVDWITLAATVATATIAAGPWLGRWLRRLPATEGPPASAVILLLLLASTPTLTGYALYNSSPGLPAWLLVLWSGILALGLARAMASALWVGRIGHIPVSIASGLLLGIPAAVPILAKAAIETSLIWRRDLHLAISPLVAGRATAVAIPPELMDPTIMKAVGLDDRGLPLEDS